MRHIYTPLLAALLVASPLVGAHTDGIVGEKTYCEDTIPGETETHDYGPSAAGFFVGAATDSSIPPCPFDPFWDGHYEFALGGAYLLACESHCYTESGEVGDGVLACWETVADHSEFPDVFVYDAMLTMAGVPVTFWIGADAWDNVPESPDLPPEPSCGDFEVDILQVCVDSCNAPFPPGLDGSYVVSVEGSYGHISTAGFVAGTAPLMGLGAVKSAGSGNHPHFCPH